MIPLLLMTPSETRNADGPVPVEVSDSVTVVDGAWVLARGIGDASLLLSPDGSHDADGPVEPTITGDVSVVAGQYGQAWDVAAFDARVVTHTITNMFGAASGTVVLRVAPRAPAYGAGTSSSSFLGLSSGSAGVNRVDIMRSATRRLYAVVAGSNTSLSNEGYPWPDDAWLTMAVRWTPTTTGLLVNGDVMRSGARTNGYHPPANSSLSIGGGGQYTANAIAEGVLAYPTALPDAEVQRLSQMPRAWTWGPDGTLSAPLATAPASILLRTRSGETVTTHHIAGASGEAGGATVTHDSTTLTIGTNNEIEVVGVLAFDTPLSEREIARYTDMPTWLGWRVFGELPASNVVRPSSPPYIAQTRIWRCDRDGRKIEELPLDMPVQGTITCNEDTRPARKLSLEVNDPDRLEPFRDWIMPEITLTDAAGISRTQAFGLYMVTPPRTKLSSSRYSGTIEGMGVTWRLLRATVANGRTIPAGTDHGAAARSIVLESGISPAQVSIPDTGTTLASPMRVDHGDRIMDVATALLNAANWYAPYMINAGQIVTAPTQELATAGATIRYSADRDDVQIIPDLDEDPNWDRLRNKVTVRNIAPSRDPIYATAEITNPSHPLYHDPGDDDTFPVWLSETVNDPQIENEAAARTRARRLLSEGASYYRPLTVRTVLDMDADMHDVIELDLQRHGKTYDGLWFRRAWQLQLRGITAVTESQLWRIEPWE